MKVVYYQDKEIIIRNVHQEDIVSLFSWNIDKEINRHDPRPLPNNCEELIKECHNFCNTFNNQIINDNADERKYLYYMITDLEDKPIGFVNFFSINKEKRQGEMGILIGDKRYWKNGIGFRAVNQVVYYIFENMDIERVYIETEENNVQALRLFEKCNFTRCGEMVEDDGFKFIVMEIKRT